MRVIDGDTVDVDIIEVYKERFSELKNKRERIRLADINAPELGSVEGETSKLFLARLLQGAQVYVDIDDVYVRDRYGRIVAVIYKPVNNTHAVNVNMLLVVENMANIVDYRNEFDPQKWQLHVEIPRHVRREAAEVGAEPGIWEASVIAVIVLIAFIAAIIVTRKIRR
ncbi:MAG: thermonuclease family protein [Acidilobaceae archaeon]